MISVNFTADVENIVATEHLYQWDNGQKLSISGVGTTADIHFANKKSEKALVVTPNVTSGACVVFIPNSLLAEPYPIIAYVYVPSDNGSKTIKSVTINVEARKQPSDFVLEDDVGVTTLESISQRANAMIQNATNQVNTAISNMNADYGNFKTTIQSELADMVANTTIPNADTVDGKHASDFVANILSQNHHFSIAYGDHTYLTKTFDTDIPNLPAVANYTHIIDRSDNGKVVNVLSIGVDYTKNVYVYNRNSGIWKNIADVADTAKAVQSATSKALLYENGEGGNLKLVSPDGTKALEIDLYNNSCMRFILWEGSNPITPLTYDFTTKKFNINGNVSNANTAGTAGTAGTLATTPTNVCLRNISFGTAEPQVTDSSAEGYVAEGALYGQYV